MKKKIAFLSNSLARGGAETVLSRIIPHLMDTYEIYLILIDGSKIEYECPAEIIKIGGAEKESRILYLIDLIKAKKKLKMIVDEYDIECVVSLCSVPNLMNVIGRYACKKVICIHGSMDYELKNGLYGTVKYFMSRKLFDKADGIVCVSRVLRQELISKWRIKSEKIATIENPCDFAEVNILSKDEMSESEELFYRSHRVIVTVGRIEKEKGYTYLLDSFKQLLSYRKDAGLVIVGDGSERGEIEKKINHLGIEKNVMLCGMKKNPFPYVKSAEIFVLSSITEALPNVLIEAMCCGTAIVACDCKSGPREILYQQPEINAIAKGIEMADYGILVPDFTSRNHMDREAKQEILANAINILLKDDMLRQKYEKEALIRAESYTIKSCVEKYKEVIE